METPLGDLFVRAPAWNWVFPGLDGVSGRFSRRGTDINSRPPTKCRRGKSNFKSPFFLSAQPFPANSPS